MDAAGMSNGDGMKRLWRGFLMRKILVPVFTVLFLFSLAASVFANPPQDMQLKWEDAGETLNVHLLHRSDNPKRHYIDSIRVPANDKQVESATYKEQPEQPGQP